MQPVVLEYRSSDLPRKPRQSRGSRASVVGLLIVTGAVVVVNAALIWVTRYSGQMGLEAIGAVLCGLLADGLILLLGLCGIPIVCLLSKPKYALLYTFGAMVIPLCGVCIAWLAICGG